MRLEDELMTTKFSSEAQKAHLNILFTASWLRGKMSCFFRNHGITMEQYNVLRIVRGHNGTTALMVKDISARMIERSSNTTRIIDRLEDKGFLRRDRQKGDKRVISISLTPKGQELLCIIDQDFIDHDPHATSLCPDKTQHINELLDELRSAYEAYHGCCEASDELEQGESLD